MVTFEGASADFNDPIAQLVRQYHIGGVLLRSENGNIGRSAETVIEDVRTLTLQLQTHALSTQMSEQEETSTPNAAERHPLPLFIAAEYEGDGPPYSFLHSGLTPLPNAMSIGATWDTAYAETVGQIVGRELSALGINFLLGPLLDIAESPNPLNPSDLGTRTFGGNPFWVGQMGASYVEGVKAGSGGKIALVAKHFPGYGSSDRPTDQEIATIHKSLAQLQQADLIPFHIVTSLANDEIGNRTVDGLATTHIRYQGLDPALRESATPITFSPQTLSQLLTLAPFDRWHEKGGIVMSDALGSSSVQTFFDPLGQTFPHRQIAKDAFAAGNDLLLLSDFALGSSSAPYADQLANIQDVLNWFVERYNREPDFQKRVDETVIRILGLKLRLYPTGWANLATKLPTVDTEQLINAGNAALLGMPDRAITLLAPSGTLLPPPSADENIVIFTDMQFGRQCTNCPNQPYIGINTIEERLIAFYGPSATNQITPSRLRSFAFSDLATYLLNGDNELPAPATPPTPTVAPASTATPQGFIPTALPSPTPSVSYLVQEALRSADWLIFAMLSATPEQTSAQVVKQFLAKRPLFGRSAHVAVLAYNAPYYLDATEISKLARYIAVYNKTPPFIDASLRVLFQEYEPIGRAPVNIVGIGYDLANITQPNPNQKINLFILQEDGQLLSPSSDAPIKLDGGEGLTIVTNAIRDTSGNIVPDGTIVRFLQEDLSASQLNVLAEAPTLNGVATYPFLLPEGFTGRFRIRAISGAATISDEVMISGNEAAVITPTPTTTPTPTVTPTPTPTETPVPTETPIPTLPPQPINPSDQAAIIVSLAEGQALVGFLAGLGIVVMGGVFIGRIALPKLSALPSFILITLLGSLLLYNYVTLQLIGSAIFGEQGLRQALMTTLLGGALGGIVAWLRHK